MNNVFLIFILVASNLLAINPDGRVGRIGLHLLPSYTMYFHSGYGSSGSDRGFNGSYGFSLPLTDKLTTGFTYQMQRISNRSIFHTFLLSGSIYTKSDSLLPNPDGPIGYPIFSPIVGMNAFVGTKGIVAGINFALPISKIVTIEADYLLSRLSQDNIHSSGGGICFHFFNKGIEKRIYNPDGSTGSVNLFISGHYQKYGTRQGTAIGSTLQIPLPVLPITFNFIYDHVRLRSSGYLLGRDNTFGAGISLYFQ